jgi:hypothetical protein
MWIEWKQKVFEHTRYLLTALSLRQVLTYQQCSSLTCELKRVMEVSEEE